MTDHERRTGELAQQIKSPSEANPILAPGILWELCELEDEFGGELGVMRTAKEMEAANALACLYTSHEFCKSAGVDDHGATVERMARILTDNPEMSREDAFCQAVAEIRVQRER